MAMLKDDELTTQELNAILLTGFFVIVVMYANGKNRVFGIENGMTAESIETVSGQKFEDMNGSTLNFTGKELAMPPMISTVKAEALLVPAS